MKSSPVFLLTAISLSAILLSPLPRYSSRAQDPGVERDGRQKLFGTGSIPELRLARNLTWRHLEDHREEFGLDRKNHMKLLRAWVESMCLKSFSVREYVLYLAALKFSAKDVTAKAKNPASGIRTKTVRLNVNEYTHFRSCANKLATHQRVLRRRPRFAQKKKEMQGQPSDDNWVKLGEDS